MRSILARSLLARTVTLVCAPLLLTVAVATAGAIDCSNQDARRALGERARQTGALLTGGIGNVLWNLDGTAARAILRPLADDPDFAGARILNTDGTMFVVLGDFATSGDGLIVERVPLLREAGNGGTPQRIGELELRLATARAEATIMERARGIALIGFGLLIAVCGLLVLIVRGVTAPIRAMTDSMAALAAGATDVPVPVVRRLDEVGRMAAALGTLKQHAVERAGRPHHGGERSRRRHLFHGRPAARRPRPRRRGAGGGRGHGLSTRA